MAIKVLVVDDEKDIVELVRYHLHHAGFQCLEAQDGPTALRLAREHRPELMILDLMLPGLDGLEVCRQLRRDPATARLPVIMLTAKAEEVDRVVGLEVGADDYVVKPFSPLLTPASRACAYCEEAWVYILRARALTWKPGQSRMCSS